MGIITVSRWVDRHQQVERHQGRAQVGGQASATGCEEPSRHLLLFKGAQITRKGTFHGREVLCLDLLVLNGSM